MLKMNKCSSNGVTAATMFWCSQSGENKAQLKHPFNMNNRNYSDASFVTQSIGPFQHRTSNCFAMSLLAETMNLHFASSWPHPPAQNTKEGYRIQGWDTWYFCGHCNSITKPSTHEKKKETLQMGQFEVGISSLWFFLDQELVLCIS